MCNPAVVPIVLGGASLGLQLWAMSKQEEAAQMAAAQARQNRANALWAAQLVKADANYEAMRLEMRADQMVSHITAASGAGNVDLSGGNPVRLKSDVRVLSEIDKDMVILRGEQKARGYILQGDTFNAQAAIESLKGDMAEIAGIAGMLNTVSYLGSTLYKNNLGAEQPTSYNITVNDGGGGMRVPGNPYPADYPTTYGDVPSTGGWT